MKAQLDENKVISSGNFQTKSFGFSERRLAHIFDMLSTKTYSNAISAPMREYATNGIDAMIEAGTIGTRQLEITLPTRFEPSFRVRDYGTGLSPEKIDQVYTLYGESTKEDSNEFNGMLGIGSKSAYAYTRSWTIVSFVDGVKTTYNAFVDDAKMPQMATLLTEETDEPNGVEIIIPVRPDDITNFGIAAQRIYSYFTPMPIIHNALPAYPIERKNALFEGQGWRITGVRNTSMAVMGNVAYALDMHQVIVNPSDEDKAAGITGGEINRLLAEYGLEIDFPIGDLEFAISREALYYTNFTKRNLTKRIEEIRDDVAKQVLASFDFSKINNLWDAKKHYRKIFNDLGSLGQQLSDELKGQILWQGIPIENDYFRYNSDDTTILYYTESYRRNSKLTSRSMTSIQAKDNTWVVINDLNVGKGSPSRLLKLYEDNSTAFNGIYVITFKDDAEKAKFFASTHFNTVPYLLLSQMPKMPTVKTAGNAKHNVKCFAFNRTASVGYSGANSDAWDTATIDIENGTGIWVKIDRFEVQKPNGTHVLSAESFKSLLTTLENIGVTIPVVHGVKPTMLEKKTMGAGWVDFFDWAKAELEKLMSSKNVLQKSVDLEELTKYYRREYEYLFKHVNKINGQTSAMRDLILALQDMILKDNEKVLVASFTSVYASMGISLVKNHAPSYKIGELMKVVEKTYPLIEALGVYQQGTLQNEILTYVNLIDEKLLREKIVSEGC